MQSCDISSDGGNSKREIQSRDARPSSFKVIHAQEFTEELQRNLESINPDPKSMQHQESSATLNESNNTNDYSTNQIDEKQEERNGEKLEERRDEKSVSENTVDAQPGPKNRRPILTIISIIGIIMLISFSILLLSILNMNKG